jgi:cytochrome P450
MFPTLARASFLDSLRFSLFHALPMALQGVFRKRPFWVCVVGRFHPDPLGRRFVARLRRRYHARCIDLSMLGQRTRLVLDPEIIRQVLERSPDAYAADPRSKREGMSVFQPHAVTISLMPEWAVRRWFNDAVLEAAIEPPLDQHFLEVVRDEIKRRKLHETRQLVWSDLEELFERVTLRVVFGDGAREDRDIVSALDALMGRANRVIFRRRSKKDFKVLSDGIRRYLKQGDPGSLVGIAARVLDTQGIWPGNEVPPHEVIRPENQVPHWLFAMKDTLAANTAFALGLLAAHPKVDDAVRARLPVGRDLIASDLHAAVFLESCIQEGMRLWPTTPMLLREAATGGVLGGDVHVPGLQVLIWNAAIHRDPILVADPDRFVPARWADSSVDWRFNHLSNGRQGCAGKKLALFLAKAVIAELSGQARLTLVRPALPLDGQMPETFNWFQFKATLSGPFRE